MPLWYRGTREECLAVRNQVGIFDVSHMGRILISGEEAEAFLNFVTTNDVSALRESQGHYSLMCNESGGIKDDLVLTRISGLEFILVYNATNRISDFEWLSKNTSGFKVKLENVSDSVGMFAVQGPRSCELLERVSAMNLSNVPRFCCTEASIAGVRCLLTRTGYTGEDGFEVFVWNSPVDRPTKALDVWNRLLKTGESVQIQPCGLAARDVLRLEAGMCLYGVDIDETTTPYEARLGFTVKLQKAKFIGKEVLEMQKREGVKRVRVGLKLLHKGIPRSGFEVLKDGERIGIVTSGTFSPTLNQGIAMAYIPPSLAREGEKVLVRVRDRVIEAMVTIRFPFYDPSHFGWQRKA
jgi:aminomethyltransferase